ncbi:MAG: hypothetical protein ABL958_06920 [Bdellovibrionia bacterium]
MPGKKPGLKAERKKTAKPQAAKKAAPAKQTEKLEPKQPMAKVHPFSKFIQRRHDHGNDTSARWYQEPPRKKAV